MKKVWDPSEPIETLFAQINDANKYSIFAATPLQEHDLLQAAEMLVLKTGQFTQEYRDWRALTDNAKTISQLSEANSTMNKTIQDNILNLTQQMQAMNSALQNIALNANQTQQHQQNIPGNNQVQHGRGRGRGGRNQGARPNYYGERNPQQGQTPYNPNQGPFPFNPTLPIFQPPMPTQPFQYTNYHNGNQHGQLFQGYQPVPPLVPIRQQPANPYKRYNNWNY